MIGHEIMHVIERHANARASSGALAQLGIGIGAIVLGGGTPEGQQQMAQILGIGAQFGAMMPYSRSHETDADLFGLDLMADAGFDPRQSVELWKNMARAGGAAPPEFMSTHPSHSTRIADLEQRLATAMPRYERARAAGRRPSGRR